MASIPIARVLEAFNKARVSANGKAMNGPYEAEVKGRTTILRHYGTMIYHSEGKKVISLGGYSASDQAAIATALYYDGISLKVTKNARLGKKMGARAVGGWFLY